MFAPLKQEILNVGDLSHEARRFRTIVWAFQRNIELLFAKTGLSAEIDPPALAEAFSRWRLCFDETKYLAEVDRRDFIIYAAGMMLRELIIASPLKSLSRTGAAGSETPPDRSLSRWPEGYAYTSFCFSLASAILKEAGEPEPGPAGITDEFAFWDSFRENVAQDPARAVPFFDLICGEDPNWEFPWIRRAHARREAYISQDTRHPAPG
ncbi:hypothetical protein BH10PSE7_BH10PSE7_16050 [soil metagenome]